jgi:hypothetical protein
MNRFRRANKVLRRIRPFIAETQGELAVTEIPGRLRDLILPPMGTTKVPTSKESVLADDSDSPPGTAG